MVNIEQLKKHVFKGFMTEEETDLLYELARKAAQFGPCLEIGSYCGLSSAYLGLGCREAKGILFSIDHHRGSEEQQPGQEYFDPELFDPKTGKIDTLPLFRKTIHDLGLEDTVVPIVSRSEILSRFWGTRLSLIFIDGSHTLESAFGDYAGWITYLLPGGYLIIHDLFPDSSKGGQAPRCVYQLARSSGLFEELPMVHTMGVLRRAAVGSVTDAALERWHAIHS